VAPISWEFPGCLGKIEALPPTPTHTQLPIPLRGHLWFFQKLLPLENGDGRKAQDTQPIAPGFLMRQISVIPDAYCFEQNKRQSRYQVSPFQDESL
jgi:hypothetical protein